MSPGQGRMARSYVTIVFDLEDGSRNCFCVPNLATDQVASTWRHTPAGITHRYCVPGLNQSQRASKAEVRRIAALGIDGFQKVIGQIADSERPEQGWHSR